MKVEPIEIGLCCSDNHICYAMSELINHASCPYNNHPLSKDSYCRLSAVQFRREGEEIATISSCLLVSFALIKHGTNMCPSLNSLYKMRIP